MELSLHGEGAPVKDPIVKLLPVGTEMLPIFITPSG
jgi:hypothetical protein